MTPINTVQIQPAIAENLNSARSATLKRCFFVLLVLWELFSALSLFAQNVDSNAVVRAERFMAVQQRGSEVLNYLHFGATYEGYAEEQYLPFANGSFALLYRFNWTTTGSGYTETWFVFNSAGQFEHLEVARSTAQWVQPFVMANVSISLVGNMLIEQYQDRLSDADRRILQRLVSDADAKGLLEWQLRSDQTLGA